MVVSPFKTCNRCAHNEYCFLGGECVNEGYQYFMSKLEVRDWDGNLVYTRSLTGGWHI